MTPHNGVGSGEPFGSPVEETSRALPVLEGKIPFTEVQTEMKP